MEKLESLPNVTRVRLEPRSIVQVNLSYQFQMSEHVVRVLGQVDITIHP